MKKGGGGGGGGGGGEENNIIVSQFLAISDYTQTTSLFSVICNFSKSPFYTVITEMQNDAGIMTHVVTSSTMNEFQEQRNRFSLVFRRKNKN